MRSAVVAALTVVVGMAAHLAGGGMAPGVRTMVTAGALLWLLAWFASARRWTASGLLGLFLLAQIAIHASAMIEHPAHAMGSTAMAVSHIAGAALLVALVLMGESALWSLVDHLALRCLRLMMTGVASVTHHARFVAGSAPAQPAPWSPRSGRAPPALRSLRPLLAAG